MALYDWKLGLGWLVYWVIIVVLWVSLVRERGESKTQMWIMKIVLGLILAILSLGSVLIFFVTCYGIGVAGCL